ncbi:predicted protein [Aspergillus terreus NIH2624]|uniref:Uncharacterized protein n=1 Tax=Aspergillus terreus (strain NIH 2624 / FGSC A1156) TaxID=341663 RepID=Q0C8Q7_ASPTN|nr:uncharacterized protein ATEG_09927 [Aspergillus terreus NIH2624]EAU30118.1 predicted protein [Aspergillus terreus NIH2624]
MGGLSAACPDDIQVHFGDSPGLDSCRDGVLDWQGPPAEEMMTTHIVDSNLVLPSFDSQWTWDTFIPHVLPETRHTSFRDEGAFFDHWQPSSCNMHLESQQATAPLTSPTWT